MPSVCCEGWWVPSIIGDRMVRVLTPPRVHAWGPRLAAIVAFLLTVLVGGDASAYQWMLRHGYAGCASCHTDPSGGGLLEPYGSLIANELLRTHYSDDAEESRAGEFLGGLVPLPEPLRLKGDVRLLSLSNKIESRPIDRQWIWMQADF